MSQRMETLPSTVSDCVDDDFEYTAGYTLIQHYFMILRSSNLQSDFQKYLSQIQSTVHLFALNILVTGLVYPQLIVQPRLKDTSVACQMKILEIIFVGFIFVLNWSYCLIVMFPALRTSSYWSEKKHRLLQGTSIVLMTMMLGFNLLRRTSTVYVNNGNDIDFLPIFQLSYRNIYQNVQVFPMDSALWLALVPIAQTIVMKEYRVSVLLFVYLVSLFAMCFASIYWHYSSYVIPIIVAYGSFGGMILLDYLKQHLLLFFLHRELVAKMQEQERNAEEMLRKEMRHMIANVAHDLKSPLSSFMNGIEVTEDDLRIIRSAMTKEARTIPTAVQESLLSIESTTSHIKSLNTFMLMTINRCLDSTKASSDMKLLPKYETICLEETLSLPVECMTNTQEKIEIRLVPWNKRQICSHILTDKQWLQENLLCLLSNAVKYSSEGLITISVQLKSKKAIRKRRDPNEVTATVREGRQPDEAQTSSHVLHLRPNPKSHPNPNAKNGSLMSRLFSWTKYRVLPDHQLLGSLPAVSRSTSNQQDQSDHTPSGGLSLSTLVNSIRSLYNSISPLDGSKELKNLYLVFSIEDTGIGMSDEARKELFSPFRQNQRLAGGTGLGLYSLSKRVDALKGYYGVEKRRDGQQGSLFWFAIPYKPDAETARMAQDGVDHVSPEEVAALEEKWKALNSVAEESSEEKLPVDNLSSISIWTERLDGPAPLDDRFPPHKVDEPTTDIETRLCSSSSDRTTGRISFGKYNILIADDAISVSKMMKKLLERHGHRVTVVDNGAVAFNTVHRLTQSAIDSESTEQHDVILMDLQMPVMDGIEATKRIRAFEKEINSKYQRNFHQLIICVSGNSDTEIVEEAREAGIDAFIPKPISYETFLTTVERLLKQVESKD